MSLNAAQPNAVLADVWSRTRVADVVTVIGATALTALMAQLSLPVPGSPVPVTGQTFAVLLSAAAIGPLRGALAQLLYLAVALVGLPVLAQGAHGPSVVFGATGGYLAGFVIAALVAGVLARRGWTRHPLAVLAVFAASTATIYLFGVTWLAHAVGQPLSWAVEKGLVPFLIGDALKALLAAGLLPLAWRGVRKLEGRAG